MSDTTVNNDKANGIDLGPAVMAAFFSGLAVWGWDWVPSSIRGILCGGAVLMALLMIVDAITSLRNENNP